MKKFLLTLVALGLFLALLPAQSKADQVADLQAKIADTQKQRTALLAEQQKLQAQIDEASKQGSTLKSTLAVLQASKNKIDNDLKVTQKSIDSANLTIQKLTLTIGEKQQEVTTHKAAIAQSLRQLSEYDSHSLLADILQERNLAAVWHDVDSLKNVEDSLGTNIAALQSAQVELSKQKSTKESQKTQLTSLKSQLSGQQASVAETQAAKAKLLADTQNQEALYQKLLAENISKEKQFEAEQFQYESQLKFALDPKSIPSANHSVLQWPLTSIFVTQYFGYTPEAAILYHTTQKHGGVDFRASIGTPVMAAFDGVVTDTEAVKFKQGCQYGKWILLKHPNGLSTIYGHLSSLLVKPGDTVTTGEIIGYSGQTGYATGPHLHFGLYATAGIRIVDASTLGSTNCAGIKTVAAPLDAYLDPLAYLPAL